MKRNMFNLSFKDNNHGFSIMEMIAVVLILAVLFNACIMVLSAGTDSWQVNNVQIKLHQNLRKGMEWMKDDLRQSGSSSITNVPADGNTYTTITFKTCNGISGSSISWSANTTQFLKGGTNSRQLLRRVSGVDKILADDLQVLTFRRASTAPNIVEVVMTAQKSTPKGTSVTASLNFKVELRN